MWFTRPSHPALQPFFHLLHWLVRVVIMIPSLLGFLSLLIAFLPLRVVEHLLHTFLSVPWESMFLFHFVRISARYLLFLLGLDLHVDTTQLDAAIQSRHSSGSNPHASSGSNPHASSGSNPHASSGSNPHASSGSNPHASSGSNPHASSGSHVIPPMVLAFNHYSFLDGIVLTAAAPMAHSYVAKAELLWYPLINVAMYVMGHFFVRRTDRTQATHALRHAADAIRVAHRSVAISPEGTRSYTGNLRSFKKGPFRLAQDASAAVCPVAIRGAFDVWPRMHWVPRYAAPIHVVFAAPIPFPSSLPQHQHQQQHQQPSTSAPPKQPSERALRSYWAALVWDQLRLMLDETDPKGLVDRPTWEDENDDGNEDDEGIHATKKAPIQQSTPHQQQHQNQPSEKNQTTTTAVQPTILSSPVLEAESPQPQEQIVLPNQIPDASD